MWWFLLDLYINKRQFTKVSRPEPCLWILYSLFPKSAQHTVLKFGMGKEAALNSGLCFFIQVWLIYNGVPISAARQSDSVLHIYEWVSEVAQLSPTLCHPVDCSLPGFSVHRILQAWILEWVTISFSRGSSRPRYRAQVSCIGGRSFNLWATREALFFYILFQYGLSQEIGYCSLCHTVGPYCLSILNVITCIYQPQIPSPSLTLPPGNHKSDLCFCSDRFICAIF